MATDETEWPPDQRSYLPDVLVEKIVNYSMQIQDEEGRWIGPFGGIKSDRAEMTRVQLDRERRWPSEKRRILKHELHITVDEVEGDGEGETSHADLMARNEQDTARLLKADEEKQTILPNGKTLHETLGTAE